MQKNAIQHAILVVCEKMSPRLFRTVRGCMWKIGILEDFGVNRTPELDAATDELADAFLKSLNKASVESGERHMRYDLVYHIERTKWPDHLGFKTRDRIPAQYHNELDEHIRASQVVARDSCQTREFTARYLLDNLEK